MFGSLFFSEFYAVFENEYYVQNITSYSVSQAAKLYVAQNALYKPEIDA